MNERENEIRAVRFQNPDHIPVRMTALPSVWMKYGAEFEELALRHPRLFPGLRPGAVDFENPPMKENMRADRPWRDPWGCVWKTSMDGVVGTVVEHPLADWDALESYEPPDPERTTGQNDLDWPAIEARVPKARAAGRLTAGGLEHGHLFLRLTYLRGFENLIFDMFNEDPRLDRLIGIVESFSAHIVRRFVAAGVDRMGYPEDLGAQRGPMISPDLFRRHIKPVYERLMAPAREAGCLIHMHSDGHIMNLLDDLIESGVDSINLQDRVNGLENIERELKGRICIDLDLDRQGVSCFGAPGDVDELVREAVVRLGDPRGGLSLISQTDAGFPLENIRALMEALEKYSTYFRD